MLLSAEKNDNDAIVFRYFENKNSIVFKQIVIDLSQWTVQ